MVLVLPRRSQVGVVLCCVSTSTSDFVCGKNRFWAPQNKSVAEKVWEHAKLLGGGWYNGESGICQSNCRTWA